MKQSIYIPNKTYTFLIYTILFLFIGHFSYGNNSCPKWFPMPSNDLVVVIPIYNNEITDPDLDCDGVIDSDDGDIDGDGILNINDAFPQNPNESVDTDGDGIGNNADNDDDNDGYSDIVELIAGSNPLDVNDTPINHPSNIYFNEWIRTNPGGGGAFSMIGATAHDKYLVAGSDLSGVYMSEDNGKTWYVRGENSGLTDTSVQALGFDPENDKIFYIGATNGIYKTEDGGKSFFSITPSSWSSEGDGVLVESIVSGKNNLYVTYHTWTNEGHPSKISVSPDKGSSWKTLPSIVEANTTLTFHVTKLLIHPSNDKILYALSGNSRYGCSPARVYRLLYDSTTGEANGWKEIGQEVIEDTRHNDSIDEVNSTIGIFDVEIDIDNINTLYMSTFNAKKCSYEFNPSDTAEAVPIYEYIYDEDVGNIYKSTNQGDTFASLSTDASYTGMIFSVGGGEIRVVNSMKFETNWKVRGNPNVSESVWKYTDSNKIWNRYDQIDQWDIGPSTNPNYSFGFSYYGISKTLTKDPFNLDNIYGTYGFNGVSHDGGKTFTTISTTHQTDNTWRSTGLDNINGTVIDVSDSNKNIIYMGGYDIGLWMSKNHGESWRMQIPQNAMYSKYVWGQQYDHSESSNPSGTNVATLVVDPTNEKKVWSTFGAPQDYTHAGTDENGINTELTGLFKSVDYGDTWQLVTGGDMPKDGRMYGLSVDSKSSEGKRTLYMTVNGHVQKSIDDGITWEQMTPNGANGICGLAVMKVNASTSNGCGLKVTAIDSNNSRIVYAGGESGLWRSIDAGVTWTQLNMNHNIPNVFEANRTRAYHMNRDIVPTYNEHHDDSSKPYAWEGVFYIKTDPSIANRVYVTVFGAGYGDKGGLYRSDDAGKSWKKITLPSLDGIDPDRYLRGIAIDPNNSNLLFISSSQAYHSGGGGNTSVGILYSTDAGSTWNSANNNMAWNFGGMMEVENTTQSPRIWAWSPGTGVQYADIIKQ